MTAAGDDARLTPVATTPLWMAARVAAIGCLALLVYYARFFLLRQQPFTIVQMGLLAVAAWLLIKPRTQRPLSWPRLIVLGVMAIIVYVLLGAPAHSVSDLLNAVVPSYCLLAALALGDTVRRAA